MFLSWPGSDMTFNAAIVGCGNIAGGYDERKRDQGVYSHAGAYRQQPNVQLIAVADSNAKRLAIFGKFWKVRYLYRDLAALLGNHRIDILSIAVPDESHARLIEQTLKAQAPPRILFVEKPLARNRQEAHRLLDLAQSKGSRIVLNCQRRWDIGHRKVRDFISNGHIGQVVAVSVFYVKGLYHVGCTVVNTIRFLVSEIESVQALGGTHQETLKGDPSVDAALYLVNGATAVMMGVDRYGYYYSLFEIDILGTKGRVRLTDNGDTITVFKTQAYRHYPGFRELRAKKTHPLIHAQMGMAIPHGIRQMVRFLSGAEELPPDSLGEQGYLDLCVLDALAKSRAHGGLRVAVKP